MECCTILASSSSLQGLFDKANMKAKYKQLYVQSTKYKQLYVQQLFAEYSCCIVQSTNSCMYFAQWITVNNETNYDIIILVI